MRIDFTCAALLMVPLALPGSSACAELNGYAGLEGRYFNHQPLLVGQARHSASLAVYPEFCHDTEDASQRLAFTLVGRVDSADDERTHADIREQQLPGGEGRLRPGVPIIEEARYQSGAEERHVDYAFRWSHYLDVWDLSLSHFSGTSRDPVYQPEYSEDGSIGLRPYYQQIDQTGLAVQATVAAWLWKLELVSVKEHAHGRNSAAVGGFEYSIFSIGGTNTDLGLIAEYQFDDRTGARQPVSQNDLAVGFRWAFNDIDSSEILWIASQDMDSGNRFYSLEANRRITDYWKIEAEARVFSGAEQGTVEYDLRNDDYLQVEVRRYF